MFDRDVLDMIRNDFKTARFGGRGAVATKWAKQLGCSRATIYRSAVITQKRIERAAQIPGIEEYASIVAQIKKKPPTSIGEIATDQAIAIAIQAGKVPEELRDKVSTFNRTIRRMGLCKRQRRVVRFQAEHANQLHHIDASSSSAFYVAGEIDGGNDYVLKLHARNKGYKNKPVTKGRLRPWLYGLVDDFSGVVVCRYVAAMGESAVDNLDFIQWAWAQNEDKPFFGLPEKIKGDLGPMMRGPAAKDFFARLGVEIDPSLPENKEAHGKIERPWRTHWSRFERTFFVQGDWRKFEIPLSELNRQFLNYQKEYNGRSHRYERSFSRLQIWKKSITEHGGAVAIPQDAIGTVARRDERTVDAAGCFSLDGMPYEVKGLHAAKAYVYRGVFDGKIVVQDKATGKRYEVEDFFPLPAGEYRRAPDSAHQKAVKEAAALDVSSTLYSQAPDAGNVVHLPTRVKETRTVENPLDTDRLPDLESAWAHFVSVVGQPLPKEYREAFERRISREGLSRQAITDLALEVCRAITEKGVIRG